MATMQHTSRIDKAIAIFRYLTTFLLWAFITMGVFEQIEDQKLLSALEGNATLNVIAFITILLICSIATRLIYISTIGKVLNILSSFLYVRLRLKTRISWQNANYASFLFIPNRNNTWYPMLNVLTIPKEEREEYIEVV